MIETPLETPEQETEVRTPIPQWEAECTCPDYCGRDHELDELSPNERRKGGGGHAETGG